jgi:hypothetical protein
MPRDEYSRIVRGFDESGEPRPRGSDEFSGPPGYDEGDYPPWLQAEMDWIAEDIWSEFGTLEDTMLNGSYWHIPESKRKAV